MTPQSFALFFLSLLSLSIFARLVLMLRQMRHVRLNRDRAPEPFAQFISGDAHRKAADYLRARMQVALAGLFIGASFLIGMTWGGGLQALHDQLSHLFSAGSLLHGIALLAGLATAGWLIELPLTLYRIFGVERRFGFNRMTPGLFIADLLRGAFIVALIGLPALAAVLWLMNASTGLWWLWVWLFWLGLNLMALIVWPLFIAPLFNRFTPLQDEGLNARIGALLQRCGFPPRKLYVMDGSRRSTHGNAYFTGFGAARRIVFFDTLLEKLTPDEVEAVLAHELGHFHHRHIVQRIGVTAGTSLGLLWMLAQLADTHWFYAGLGVTAPDSATALALFSLVLPVVGFLLTPLASHWSRRHEFEADRYAAHHAQAEHLASALVKLYRDNAATLTPDPLYSRVFDSHPPAGARIEALHAGSTRA